MLFRSQGRGFSLKGWDGEPGTALDKKVRTQAEGRLRPPAPTKTPFFPSWPGGHRGQSQPLRSLLGARFSLGGRDSELAGLERGREGRAPAESADARMPADGSGLGPASEQRLGAGRRRGCGEPR